MMGKRTRYLTIAQRLWWLAAVLVLLIAGAAALHMTFGRNVDLEILYLLIAMLGAWGGFISWSDLVGESVTPGERKRRYAVESLARPLWLEALMFSPIFAVHPFAPLLFWDKVNFDFALIWTPIAFAASWFFAIWMRRRAAVLLGIPADTAAS